MVCFDLDMTLLDHKDYTIPGSAMRALSLLRAKGQKIVLATGRDMDNYYSREYRDIVKPDAIIHQNGTRITVGDRVLCEHFMDPALLGRILSWCDIHSLAIGVTIGDDDFYVHPEIVRDTDIRNWGSCGRHFRDPKQLLTMPVRTLALIGTPDEVHTFEKAFPELRCPIFSTSTGADVLERAFSKAKGLVRLAAYFGEPENLSSTVAFGDSMNDMELIESAGTGVAMGNAVPALKAVADYITDPIDQDGIYNACVKLGLF